MQLQQYSQDPMENHRDRENKPPWRIVLVANLKDEYVKKQGDPSDAGAEFDRLETIEAIKAALESDGHSVTFCEGNASIPGLLISLHPDIVFNIAEGLTGDGREAQVPALCEILGIPYTASRVVANAISLDKTQTKRIWREVGLPTAPFREFSSLDGLTHTALRYPMFVKPAREGTGMGIDQNAIVRNYKELTSRVEWSLNTYKQPVLIEEYLPGREFTVGFLGNTLNFPRRRNPEIYDADGYHFFPVLEIDTRQSVSPGVYGHDSKSFYPEESGAPAYLCPADIPSPLKEYLFTLTKQAAQSLNVYDVARVDFRLGANGQPYLLEINTLPGLNPQVSDLCIMAKAEGMPYTVLITEILYLAASRYSLMFESVSITPEIQD